MITVVLIGTNTYLKNGAIAGAREHKTAAFVFLCVPPSPGNAIVTTYGFTKYLLINRTRRPYILSLYKQRLTMMPRCNLRHPRHSSQPQRGGEPFVRRIE